MPSLRENFGRRLRSIRLQRELTQEQFAELTGISVDFLSLIERGINAPSFEVLEQIAEGTQLPVMALFDFDAEASAKRSAAIGVKRLRR
jgi:transcriptional regulator with XRE-family HTH domain